MANILGETFIVMIILTIEYINKKNIQKRLKLSRCLTNKHYSMKAYGGVHI
jgi:hypothetical protein